MWRRGVLDAYLGFCEGGQNLQFGGFRGFRFTAAVWRPRSLEASRRSLVQGPRIRIYRFGGLVDGVPWSTYKPLPP